MLEDNYDVQIHLLPAIRVKCLTQNASGYKQQNTEVKWLIINHRHFSPLPFLKKKKHQIYDYRASDIRSPIKIVLTSLSLLLFPFLILPSCKVASKDPTMMSALEKEWKRERSGDICCLHQEVKTFLAVPTGFTDISLTRIYITLTPYFARETKKESVLLF